MEMSVSEKKCGECGNCFWCPDIAKKFEGYMIPCAEKHTALTSCSRAGTFASAYEILVVFNRPTYVPMTEHQKSCEPGLYEKLDRLRDEYPSWDIVANFREVQTERFTPAEVAALKEFAAERLQADVIEHWNGEGSCSLSIRLLKHLYGIGR
jgi:hypothetical protein